jgi:predicted nucleic acid-binding protein
VTLVLDTSVVAAWVFNEPESAAAERIVNDIAHRPTWVTQLFPIEIANVLLVGERRERILPMEAAEQLELLSQLPLLVDDETSTRVWHQTFYLARAEQLTVYDASYLELALRLDADLATFDRDLAGAARRRGLTVLP